ncbi:AcrR family transcriptional regulator [Nocardioides daedukensis]|uniref:AcrR family transcriptional regulator n=1 Tax=Nocardioides daedukensis TaxID=634462 RepID=A0A7Y9UPR7_9ACTN|nr:TetR family transcriptional regulator [Nocardioides daedukensis]NYG59878.1 AcrR family transcriptional regulator [Nocardioides daedukensis]
MSNSSGARTPANKAGAPARKAATAPLAETTTQPRKTAVKGTNGRANAGPDARTRILNAAARLIAERGLEGVSLREITREAGQKNTTALQYHFGDREGMLRVLVDHYVPRISVRRHALLDHLLSRGEITLREGAAILVTPLIAELSDEGGRHFLQVAAQLVNRSDALVDPDDALGALVYDPDGSLDRWSTLIEELMPPRTAGPPLHRRFAAIRFVHLELGRRARMGVDHGGELFAAQLVDLAAAILGADLSPETRRIMDERHPEA